MRTLGRVGLLTFLLAAAVAGSAQASSVVYECAGHNLCSIAPDGSGQHALTTDGTDGAPYFGPWLSLDGTKMSWVHGSALFVGDPNAVASGTQISNQAQSGSQLRQDGAQVLDFEAYYINGAPYPYVCVFNSDGSGRHCPGTPRDASFMPDGRLLKSVPSDNDSHKPYGICVTVADDSSCDTFVAEDPGHDLIAPELSPDGTTVAVIAAPTGSATASGDLVLYDMAGHAAIRTVANGAEHPAWSPDGTRLVFSRGGGIWVTAATGAPGSERRIADGTGPTWGGGPDQTGGPTGGGGPVSAFAGAAIAGRTARVDKRGRVSMKVRCPATAAGRCSGTDTLRGAHDAKLGKAHLSIAAGKTKKVKIKLSRAARKLLARKHRLKAREVVVARDAGGVSRTTSARVTLRR